MAGLKDVLKLVVTAIEQERQRREAEMKAARAAFVHEVDRGEPAPEREPSSAPEWRSREARAAPPGRAPRPRAMAARPIRARVHERLRGADALREAFVLREILDRPRALRRHRTR